MQCSVYDDAVLLIVVGDAAVFARVVVVDWTREERVAHIVDCFRPGVGEPETAVLDRTQVVGDCKGVEVGVRAGVVLLVVADGRVGTAEVNWVDRRGAGGDVEVDVDEDILAADVLVGDREIAGGADLLIDLKAVLQRAGVFHVGIHRADAEPEIARQGQRRVTGDDVWEDRGAALAIAERERGERVARNRGSVAVGFERVREGAQRYAIIEQTEAAANHGATVVKGRVCEAEAG